MFERPGGGSGERFFRETVANRPSRRYTRERFDRLTLAEEIPIDGKHREFEVFFDGDCPLCRREIDLLRKWDREGKIEFTDIAAPQFAPPSDRTLDDLMRSIHGREPGGEWVTGVEVFRRLYSAVGLNRLVALSRWPLIRNVLPLGYRAFAAWRYRSAIRRMRKASCDDGTCTPLGDSQ